jgi:hypothetical protein
MTIHSVHSRPKSVVLVLLISDPLSNVYLYLLNDATMQGILPENISNGQISLNFTYMSTTLQEL